MQSSFKSPEGAPAAFQPGLDIHVQPDPSASDRGVAAYANRPEQTFPVLTSAQIARITPRGVEEIFDDGALVVEQGQSDAPFFVVLAGELEIVSLRGHVEHSVAAHRAGQFTGELTLIAQGRSLVRARARGQTVLLRIEGPALRSLVQTDAELGELVVRAFILRRVGLLSEGYGDAVLVRLRFFGGHPPAPVIPGREQVSVSLR